eukprot:gene47193-57801_t
MTSLLIFFVLLPLVSAFLGRHNLLHVKGSRRVANLASTVATASTQVSAGQEVAGPIRPSTVDKARTVTYICTSGTLCTSSVMEDVQGVPFGSYVDYVIDEKGWPILLLGEQS